MPAVTVTNAVTKILDSSANPREVHVKNTGAVVVYVAKNGGVTASDFPIAAGAEEEFTLEAGEQLFGITASGSTTVEAL